MFCGLPMEGLFLLLFGIGVCVSSLCLLCYFVLWLTIAFVFRCGFCGLILFALQVVVFGFLLGFGVIVWSVSDYSCCCRLLWLV